MARKIVLKENGLSGQPNTPSGYKYLGYDNQTLSEKAGPTVSGIGGVVTPNYIEYKSLLTQSGTASPTANVLVNTLSGTWSYSSVGSYYFESTGSFTDITKVEVYIPSTTVLGYVMSNAAFYVMSANRLDNNNIEVRTGYIKNDGTANNYLQLNGSTSVTDLMRDGVLYYTPITIRVWS